MHKAKHNQTTENHTQLYAQSIFYAPCGIGIYMREINQHRDINDSAKNAG